MDVMNWREINPVVMCGVGIDWRLMQRKGESEFEVDGRSTMAPLTDSRVPCLDELRFVSLASLQPSKQYEAHNQAHEEIYYIIKGSGMIVIDGERRRIRDGDCICTHAGQSHQIINDGEESIEFLAWE